MESLSNPAPARKTTPKHGGYIYPPAQKLEKAEGVFRVLRPPSRIGQI